VIATVIVAVMLVAVLQTVGASKQGQLDLVQGIRGQGLAQSMMSEILPLAYADPNGSSTLGRDAGESAVSRENYNDVDDYSGWVAAPPAAPDGTPIPGLTDWQREVAVDWVDPDDPATAKAAESGVKRITVTVRYNGRPIHSLTALRSAHGF
jgi:hypothetical protein